MDHLPPAARSAVVTQEALKQSSWLQTGFSGQSPFPPVCHHTCHVTFPGDHAVARSEQKKNRTSENAKDYDCHLMTLGPVDG